MALRGSGEAVVEDAKERKTRTKEKSVIFAEEEIQSIAPKTKHKHKILISLDIGFGHSKAMNNNGMMQIIPSYVQKANDNGRITTRGKKELNVDMLTVYVDGEEYQVGKFASNIFSDDDKSNRIVERNRAKDPQSRALFLSMIGLNLPDSDEEFDVIISTGLPNDDFDTAVEDELKEFLFGIKQISFKTYNNVRPVIHKFINVEHVFIYRQPEGTLFDWLYLPNFKKPTNDEDFLIGKFITNPNATIAILDIGHLTLDGIITRQMHILENKSIKGEGFGVVYERLALRLTKFLNEKNIQISLTGKDEDLDEIIRTKMFISRVEEISVAKIVDEVVYEYARSLFDNMMKAWKQDINRFEKFIITGGAAHILEPILNEMLQKNKFQPFSEYPDTTSASDQLSAQLSNCRGFYIHALYDMREDELYGSDPVFYWDSFIRPMEG